MSLFPGSYSVSETSSLPACPQRAAQFHHLLLTFLLNKPLSLAALIPLSPTGDGIRGEKKLKIRLTKGYRLRKPVPLLVCVIVSGNVWVQIGAQGKRHLQAAGQSGESGAVCFCLVSRAQQLTWKGERKGDPRKVDSC